MPITAKPMLRSAAALRGYPNPYAALDAKGMPSGFCRYDPEHGNPGEVHHVGATLKETRLTEVRDQAKGETRPTKFTVEVSHSFEPALLPHTDYFVRRFRDLDLICADEATARLCQMPFVPPSAALNSAKAAIIAEWTITYGSPPPVDSWPAAVLIPISIAAPAARPALNTIPSSTPQLAPELVAVMSSLEWMGDLEPLARVARVVYGTVSAAADGLQALQTIYLPGTVKQFAPAGVLVMKGAEPRPIAMVMADLVKAIAVDRAKEMLVPTRLRPLIANLVKAYVEGNEAAKAIPVSGDTVLAAMLGQSSDGASVAPESSSTEVSPAASKAHKKTGAAPGGDQ